MSKVIPQELKSEVAVGFGLFLADLVVIVVIFLILDLFKDLINPWLQLPWTGLSILIGLIVTRKSSKNPGKRIYESIIIGCMKDRKSYHRRED